MLGLWGGVFNLAFDNLDVKDKILQIPLAPRNSQDRMSWYFDIKGSYVNSMYHSAMIAMEGTNEGDQRVISCDFGRKANSSSS